MKPFYLQVPVHCCCCTYSCVEFIAARTQPFESEQVTASRGMLAYVCAQKMTLIDSMLQEWNMCAWAKKI